MPSHRERPGLHLKPVELSGLGEVNGKTFTPKTPKVPGAKSSLTLTLHHKWHAFKLPPKSSL
eukprot:10372980-Karenia_brevis.AAC.1